MTLTGHLLQLWKGAPPYGTSVPRALSSNLQTTALRSMWQW